MEKNECQSVKILVEVFPGTSHSLTSLSVLPLVPTRSPRHAERSRSTSWRRPELGTARRRPAGSSVVQAGPSPSPWWYHPSEQPG